MGITITLKRLLALLLVLQIGILLLKTDSVGTWGINKTVGWAWDFTNFLFLATPVLMLYVFTYCLLLVFKVKQQALLSFLSLILILVSFSFPNDIFALAAFLSSIILFLLNCIYSIYHKFKKTA